MQGVRVFPSSLRDEAHFRQRAQRVWDKFIEGSRQAYQITSICHLNIKVSFKRCSLLAKATPLRQFNGFAGCILKTSSAPTVNNTAL